MSKAKVIHKDGLFVRKDKSRSSEWVRIIPCGEEFEFYEEYKGWLKVADGWVVCNDVYIRPTEVTAGGGGGASANTIRLEFMEDGEDGICVCDKTFEEVLDIHINGTFEGGIVKDNVFNATAYPILYLSIFGEAGDKLPRSEAEETYAIKIVYFNQDGDLTRVYYLSDGTIIWWEPTWPSGGK